MRRVISLAMVFFGLATLMTGIWNLFPPFDEKLFPPHIISSFTLGLLAIIHVWLNWRTIIRYVQGLGWWWILAGIGFLLVIWMGIIAPVLNIAGVT